MSARYNKYHWICYVKVWSINSLIASHKYFRGWKCNATHLGPCKQGNWKLRKRESNRRVKRSRKSSDGWVNCCCDPKLLLSQWCSIKNKINLLNWQKYRHFLFKHLSISRIFDAHSLCFTFWIVNTLFILWTFPFLVINTKSFIWNIPEWQSPEYGKWIFFHQTLAKHVFTLFFFLKPKDTLIAHS